MNFKNYKNVIKMLRVKHDMTQQEAANLLGISTLAYRNKELGKTDFKILEVMNLFKYWDETDLNILIK